MAEIEATYQERIEEVVCDYGITREDWKIAMRSENPQAVVNSMAGRATCLLHVDMPMTDYEDLED